MPDIDLTEIDKAVVEEDWTRVLALIFATRDDPERFVEICGHALMGSWALGARTGRDMALAKFMNMPGRTQ